MFEGSGFRMTVDGSVKSIGFYASRVVNESEDGHIDSGRVIDRLYRELGKSEVVRTPASQITVSEVKPLPEGESVSSSGFTFFAE
jgi:hypothetical protein